MSVFVIMQNCWQQMGAMMINWSLHNKLPSHLLQTNAKNGTTTEAINENYGQKEWTAHRPHIYVGSQKMAITWAYF